MNRYATIKRLDHGYIKLIEHWGSDARIIEAARQSTDKGFLGWGTNDKPGDEKLLGYLWRNQHSTPFEFAGAVIEIQAPILVFREWHRHRTQSYAELSARYTPLPNKNYVPTRDRVKQAAGTNKQAQGTTTLASDAAIDSWLYGLVQIYDMIERHYQLGLRLGVPKEVARVCIPVGRYSRMRAQTNLRNWLSFLTLRMAPNAQWEIRQYANAMHDILADLYPRTVALFEEGQHGPT